MKIYLTIFLAFIGLHTFAQKQMSAAEVNTFKNKVESQAKATKSIRTDFKQEKHLSFLSDDIQSSGKMFLNKKGYLKWAYTSPNQYSIIFRDNAIYINDNGRKNTVENNAIFKNISQLIAGSMSGNMFDDSQFNISYTKENNLIVAKLIPKRKTLKKYIEEVNLFFPEKEAVVTKVKLVEPSGDYTKIMFINKELNAQIDPHIFEQ